MRMHLYYFVIVENPLPLLYILKQTTNLAFFIALAKLTRTLTCARLLKTLFITSPRAPIYGLDRGIVGVLCC